MRRIAKKVLFPAVILLAVVCFFHLLPQGSGLFDNGVLLVVLDPGHGGTASGAFYDNTYEKDLNLSVALLVKDLLSQQEGIQVLMTRYSDVAVGLYERANMANDKKADLFVSIHSNALENNNDFQGIYTFYAPNRDDSALAAEAIQNDLAAATGGINCGIRTEDFVVVRETNMPSVLIEMGFMTCPDELEKLKSAEYQAKIAQGIVNGILSLSKAPAS